VLSALSVQSFGDTFIVVAAISTVFMAGASFGWWRAIKAVAGYEDGQPPGRFVRWFVESGHTSHDQKWRGWGIGAVAVGVWLGGGYLVVVLPLSILIWAVWVR
jgi:hypothetical protein